MSEFIICIIQLNYITQVSIICRLLARKMFGEKVAIPVKQTKFGSFSFLCTNHQYKYTHLFDFSIQSLRINLLFKIRRALIYLLLLKKCQERLVCGNLQQSVSALITPRILIKKKLFMTKINIILYLGIRMGNSTG